MVSLPLGHVNIHDLVVTKPYINPYMTGGGSAKKIRAAVSTLGETFFNAFFATFVNLRKKTVKFTCASRRAPETGTVGSNSIPAIILTIKIIFLVRAAQMKTIQRMSKKAMRIRNF